MKKLKIIAAVISLFILGLYIGFNYGSYWTEQKYAEDYFRNEELSPSIPVVVANKDMEIGETIDSNTMSVRDIPIKYLSSYSVSPSEFREWLEGRKLNRNLKAGEPVLRDFVD